MKATDTGNRVPALEKGLDIIEALASEKAGLLQKDVAVRVGRSVNEIFRVLTALEMRGYIVRDDITGAYSLALKLFELAHIHPPTHRLIQISTVEMEKLAVLIGCSCHLVTLHESRILAVAQAQPETLLMGWSVKVGAAFPMSVRIASARTIAAHQRPTQQKKMIEKMLAEDATLEYQEVETRLKVIRDQGVEVSASTIAPGIIDISCPILNHQGVAIAALTVPKMGNLPEPQLCTDEVATALRGTADIISKAIGARR